MLNEICPACENELALGLYSGHLQCSKCDYEKANLQPSVNLHSSHERIDEHARKIGFRELRKNNFAKLLANLKSLKPNGRSLLDVGCAYGWLG